MHAQALLSLLPLLGSLSVSSFPIEKREVPQEHSHEQFLDTVRTSLNLNNPAGIQDPVFGLLGNAAAAAGQGSITNTDCLQQATADQAFTNAKAAGDVAGMTAALVYRALERNTGKVGLASVLCTETAVNVEIAAITQHQDPASTGAAATNKAITLELAKQIASIGGDPQTALKSGTFAPGNLSDNTGKGNTCDTTDASISCSQSHFTDTDSGIPPKQDPVGCIFTQNLLVEDATPAEISAAAAGVSVTAVTPSVAAATNAVVTSSAAAVACGAVATGTTSAAAVAASSSTAVTSTSTAITSSGAANLAATSTIDVGQCTDFSIVFAAGLDGRAATELSFEPHDLTNFNHGTALNPEIITQFMCDTFVNACGKSASTQAACAAVKSTIDAQLTAGTLSKDQTYSNAWLSGLIAAGFPSSVSVAQQDAFTAGVTNEATGAAITAVAVSATPSATTAAAATTATASTAAAVATTAATTTTTTGTNVQTFTGALNGFPAPPVIETTGAARPFSVNGDTFLNEAAALQRSCSVQFNGCANAANSGKGTSSVAECQTQETACTAA